MKKLIVSLSLLISAFGSTEASNVKEYKNFSKVKEHVKKISTIEDAKKIFGDCDLIVNRPDLSFEVCAYFEPKDPTQSKLSLHFDRATGKL